MSSTAHKLTMLLQILLIAAYPLCVHFAVTTESPELQLVAMLLLALGLTFKGIVQGSRFSIAVMAVMSLIAVLFSQWQLSRFILYLPPVILPLLFWSVFFRTLLPNQTPLVTEIGESAHDEPFCDDMRRYTRQVTLMWCVFFVALAIWSALLPVIASPEVWSLFTNFLNYGFIAALFVLEYCYRLWRFKNYEHPAFWQYLQIVIHADIRKL